MEGLKSAFIKTKEHLEQLLEEITQGRLLDKEEITTFSQLMDELGREQTRCINQLMLESGCAEDEAPRDLISLEAAFEQQRHERMLSQAKSIAESFNSIVCDDPTYSGDLEQHQSKLREFDDETLALKMGNNEMRPYMLFVNCAESPDDPSIDELAEYFDYKLSFGVVRGKFTVTIPLKLETPTAVPGAKNSANPTKKSRKNKRLLPSKTTETEVKPEAPEPVHVPEAEPLRTEVSSYGEFVKESSGKKPSGSSALLNAYRKKYHESLRFSVYFLAEHCAAPLSAIQKSSEHAPHRPALIDQSVNYLYKEGFVDKYSVNNCEPFYSLSPAGKSIFRSDTVQRQLIRHRLIKEPQTPDSLSSFLRYKEAFNYYISCGSIEFNCILSYFDGYAILGVAREDDNESILLSFIPALYGPDDNEAMLWTLIKNFSKKLPQMSDDLRLFIAAPEGQTEGWKNLFANYIKLPEGVRFYLGVLGGSMFKDEKGVEWDLAALIRDEIALDNFLEFPDDVTPIDINNIPLNIGRPFEPEKPDSQAPDENNNDMNDEPRVTEARSIDTATRGKDVIPFPVSFTEPEPAPASDTPESSLGEAATLAHKVLRLPDLLSETARLEKIIMRLLREERIMESTVLAKTLAEAPGDSGTIFKPIYEGLLYASNLPLERRVYSGSRPEPQGDSPILPYCRAVFRLWALCFPADAYDQVLYNRCKEEEALGLGDNPALEGEFISHVRAIETLAVEELRDLSFEYDGLCFTDGVLHSFITTEEFDKQLLQIKDDAQSKLSAPRSNIRINGLENLLKNTMGSSSPIGHCMSAIANSSEYDIEGVFNEFSEDGSTVSEEKLNKYIDTIWNELRESLSTIKVKQLNNGSSVRNMVLRELNKRLTIMSNWLALHASPQKESKIARFGALAEKLKTRFSKAAECADKLISENALDTVNTAGVCLLKWAFLQIRDVLDGKGKPGTKPADCFAPLLTTPYITLDHRGFPLIDCSMNELAGMEPWRMALKHVSERTSAPLAEQYQDAIHRIETSNLDPQRFEDYSSSQQIRKILGMDVWPVAYGVSLSAAHTTCKYSDEDFRGNVCLACAYGQISEQTKEVIFDKLNRFGEIFVTNAAHNSILVYEENTRINYAHYRMLLKALSDEVENVKAERKTLFLKEYESRVKQTEQSGGENAFPIFEQLRNVIGLENLAMAESYINRIDSAQTEIPQNLQEPEQNFYAQFLDCADWFIEQCERDEYKSRQLRQWGGHVLKKKNFWRHGDSEDSALLINSWITCKDEKETPETLSHLLSLFGFEVNGVALDASRPAVQTYEVFTADVTPLSAGLEKYPHPIPEFGTAINPQLSVVCLYGCKGPSSLIDIMANKLKFSGPVIVLMDGVLSTLERQQVAFRFKKNADNINSFLLIDRVLFLYIAALDRAVWPVAMLQCTLPYTFELVYNEGFGPVPDELFIGRQTELKALSEPDGPFLLYGGSGLGKTALLKRAETLFCHPENNEYTAYINIKDKGHSELEKLLRDELSKIAPGGVPLLNPKSKNLNNICKSITSHLESFNRLLVLIDDADSLLNEAIPQSYEPIQPIISLMQTAQNKVKFVFATLHRVPPIPIGSDTEYTSDNQHLCLKPLPYPDAMRLIKWPLSFMGFDIGERQAELIITNTCRYPNLIQFFCSELIKSLCGNLNSCYSESDEYPPYPLNDKHLKAVFSKSDIKHEIGTCLVSKLDRKYCIIASLMAFLDYESSGKKRDWLSGCAPEELIDCNERNFMIPDFSRDSVVIPELTAAMDEMVNMGILCKNINTNLYRFRQRDFINYLGCYDDVLKSLLDAGSEEALQ